MAKPEKQFVEGASRNHAQPNEAALALLSLVKVGADVDRFVNWAAEFAKRA